MPDPTSNISIKSSVDGEQALVKVIGKITVLTSPQLEDAVADAFDGGAKIIRIDLSETDYISSSGLRVIVQSTKMARNGDGNTIIVNPSDAVWEVLEMTGLANALDIER